MCGNADCLRYEDLFDVSEKAVDVLVNITDREFLQKKYIAKNNFCRADKKFQQVLALLAVGPPHGVTI